MSSLEKISERCLSVCQVPIELSSDYVCSRVQRHFQDGRILDLDQVSGIESSQFTRLIILCSSAKDVDHICTNVKEEEIHIGDRPVLVKYQKAIVCELPERWENIEMAELDKNQTGYTQCQQQAYAGPELHDSRTKQREPEGIHQQQAPQYVWPPGPPGAASGIYQNVQTGGYMYGSMPHQMPAHGYAQGQVDKDPSEPSGHDRGNSFGPQQTGNPNQFFPLGQMGLPFANRALGQFPPGGFPFFRMPQMPPNVSSDQQNFPGGQNLQFPPMPVPMYLCPNTGQRIPFQGYPGMAFKQGSEPHPQHPSKHSPPRKNGEFKGEGNTTEVKSPTELSGDKRQHETLDKEPVYRESEEPEIQGAEEKATKIVVTNLPEAVHDEFLEMFFEKYGGTVSKADIDRENATAIVEFKDPDDVDIVLVKGSFMMMKKEVEVSRYKETQPVPPDFLQDEQQHLTMDKEPAYRGSEESEMQDAEEKTTKIVVSKLPKAVYDEFLEMFFEKYGGTVLNVDIDEENATAIVEFKDPNDVDKVLDKGPFMMMKKEIQVSRYKESPPVPLCTIEVTGPCNLVCQEQLEFLEMYFEREKRSGGGNIVDSKFDSEMDMALITFEHEEVAKRVEERGDHTLNQETITVRLHTPASKPKISEHTERNVEDKLESLRTIKVKGVDKSVSRDTVELYFENTRRSGGGDIESIQSDEEEEDVLFITFKEKQDADKVVERGRHKVEHKELSVSFYVPPIPPPSYENKILIKGLKPTTTQDCLFNFIEAKTGFIPETMDYHAELDDIVMVNFTDNPDFKELEKLFRETRLEGAVLKVYPVPVSNCIIVANLASDVTTDTVSFYFENKRKSDGGPVDKVVMREDDTCLVYFEDYTTIDRVINREHFLSKQQLDVKRYQECLGRPEGEVGERTLNVPDTQKIKNICRHKLKFLNNSKLFHEALEKQMMSCHARLVLPADDGDVKLECTITKDMKDCFKLVRTWTKEAEESFEHFMNTIYVRQISVLQDIWDKVMKELKSISVTSPEAVAVYTEKTTCFLTVVGNRKPAEILEENIHGIVQKVMEEAEKERQKVTETYKGLKIIETRMLLADKFPAEMEECFPDMRVNIYLTKNEIVFEGSLRSVREAKLKMHEMKSEFAQRSVENISPLLAELFKAEQTKDYIMKELENMSLTGVWDIQGQTLIIVSSSEKTIDQCVGIINHSVIETSIKLTKASSSVLNSEAWQYKVDKLRSQYGGKAQIDVDDLMTKVMLCSTDEIANELSLSVKKFLRDNTILEETISCTKGLQRLIEKNHKSDISDISKSFQSFHLKITTDEHSGYKVCGTEDGIKKSKESLRILFDRVKRKYHTVVKPGLAEHMKTPRGKDNLDTIESIMPCAISIKDEFSEEQMSSNLYDITPAGNRNTNGKIKVIATFKVYGDKVVHAAVGDITEMKVQILVNAADEHLDLSEGLGKAMVLKGGNEIAKACQDYIQKEGKLYEGESFVCTAGNLYADFIVHVLEPVRGNSKTMKKQLKTVILTCMKQASKYDAASMAIPAICCGSSWYPVRDATSIIVKAIDKFFRENRESPLTDIYLCDVNSDTVNYFNESLEEEFRNIHIQEESEDEDYKTYYEGSYVSNYQRPPSVPQLRPPKGKPASDSNKTTIGNACLTLKKDGIAKEKVDVIVNTTARTLDLSKGAVSASLLTFGGMNLQKDVSTNYPDGINFGEIAVSAGHNLNCLHVFHTTPTKYDVNNTTASFELLHKLVTRCLDEAQRQNHSSIAFPAIGTGNLGFPKDIVARAMFKAVSNFCTANPNSSVKDVRFIVYQKDWATIKAFEAEQARWSSGEFKSARQKRRIDPMYERLQSRKPDSGSGIEHEYDFLPDSGESAYTNLTVTVKHGDITQEDSDCIVNSSNDKLDLKRGAVSNAILKKGGAALEDEIQRKRGIMRQNHLAWTSAHGIPSRYILHVVAQNNNKEWKTIIERCLHDAEKKKLKSIAFPALGTGLQSDPKEMADVMTCALRDFDKTKHEFLKEVRIVVFQQGMVQDFKRVVLTDSKQGSGIFSAFYNGVKGLFGGGKGGSYAEASKDTKKKSQNPDSVTFEILSMNNNVLQEAIKRLEGNLEKEIHHKEFKESIISRMDQNYIAEIEAIARDNNVQINTNVALGKIRLTGLAQNLMNASDKIHGIIRDAVTMEKQIETAEIMSCIVQWFYIEITEECGQKLVEYDKTLNFKIENAFKSQEATFSFVADDKKKYILDFKKMEEYAEDNITDTVNVIRRDLFKEGANEVPASWREFKGNLKVVNLPSTDQDYRNIYQRFQATSGGQAQISHIQRVQNKTLWNQYHTKKKQLEGQNPPNTQNENFLWHGTAEEAVDSINAHGFNRSYCGKNATAYGNGVYFAVQASLSCSNTYSRPDSRGMKRVYYCRVLTGEYAKGHGGMRVPPPKPAGGSNAIHDSVVDNPNGPGIYVIFNDTQAYPEYLVTFSP